MHANSIHDDYRLQSLLGTGAFAEVRKCEQIVTRNVRAVKIVLKQGIENWQTDP
jgi:serine/threonine protein kinase